jgi:hypothetical protein
MEQIKNGFETKNIKINPGDEFAAYKEKTWEAYKKKKKDKKMVKILKILLGKRYRTVNDSTFSNKKRRKRKTGMTSVASRQELSEYERLRISNIERNEEFLKSLGIKELTRELVQSGELTVARRAPKSKSNQKKRRYDYQEEGIEEDSYTGPQRRSRRVQNLPAEHLRGDADNDNFYFMHEEEIHAAKKARENIPKVPLDLEAEEGRRIINAKMIREIIESTNEQHDEEISNEVNSYLCCSVLCLTFLSVANSALCLPIELYVNCCISFAIKQYCEVRNCQPFFLSSFLFHFLFYLDLPKRILTKNC